MVVYLDDILVYSMTVGEHLKHLRALLSVLRQHKLYAKIAKCDFMLTKVSFLGFFVSSEGVNVDPHKIEAISSWPVPITLTPPRAFHGLASFYL